MVTLRANRILLPVEAERRVRKVQRKPVLILLLMADILAFLTSSKRVSLLVILSPHWLTAIRGYNITIRDPSLPVININDKDNPSYLPAEVCEVIPGQPARTKLSSAQTQQMIRFAVRRPKHNAESIVTSGGSLLGFEPANATLVSLS